jgi:hypothetical protein
MDSRSSAPNFQLEIVRACRAGASDAHLECQPRFKRFWPASVRCCLIISFELLGFRHNRSVQLHPELSLAHLSVDQAEASSPLVLSVTAQHAQSQLNPRAAFY